MSFEINQRKQAVIKSLFKIGESALARDWAEATEKVSFEYLEHAMRERLKSGNDNRAWKRTMTNAIAEAQSLQIG